MSAILGVPILGFSRCSLSVFGCYDTRLCVFGEAGTTLK